MASRAACAPRGAPYSTNAKSRRRPFVRCSARRTSTTGPKTAKCFAIWSSVISGPRPVTWIVEKRASSGSSAGAAAVGSGAGPGGAGAASRVPALKRTLMRRPM